MSSAQFDLTETEARMLKLIAEAGEWRGTGALGFAMWPEGRAHRTSQGMALAAGKVLRRLIKLGLVRAYGKSGGGGSFYRVTDRYRDIERQSAPQMMHS